jgi:HK97 family phage major capsid protein
MLKSKELRESRAKLIADARQILEKKELTAEDRTKYDQIMADADAQKADIDRYERVEAEDRAGAQPPKSANPADVKYEEAFRVYMRDGFDGMTPEQRNSLNRGFIPEKAEGRAAQTVTTTGGGYQIPQGFQDELTRVTLSFAVPEQAARVLNTDTGNDIPWPTLDDTTNKGRLLAINTAITNTAYAVGQVVLKAFKWSSDSILVPSELMQDSAFNMDSLLADLLGERIGRIKADYYSTGTGSSQPEGVVAGSSLGVTAASATAITAGEIIDLYHSVDPSYRTSPKTAFMFNDTFFKAARKLADTTGQYLWQPGLRAGEPDLLFGKPFFINQSMASPATGNKVALFGDFGKYIVRNVNSIALRRLNELYAGSDQVGFIAFARSDARYVTGAATNPAVKHYIMA